MRRSAALLRRDKNSAVMSEPPCQKIPAVIYATGTSTERIERTDRTAPHRTNHHYCRAPTTTLPVSSCNQTATTLLVPFHCRDSLSLFPPLSNDDLNKQHRYIERILASSARKNLPFIATDGYPIPVNGMLMRSLWTPFFNSRIVPAFRPVAILFLSHSSSFLFFLTHQRTHTHACARAVSSPLILSVYLSIYLF